jgi:hypothetical protein
MFPSPDLGNNEVASVKEQRQLSHAEPREVEEIDAARDLSIALAARAAAR